MARLVPPFEKRVFAPTFGTNSVGSRLILQTLGELISDCEWFNKNMRSGCASLLVKAANRAHVATSAVSPKTLTKVDTAGLAAYYRPSYQQLPFWGTLRHLQASRDI